MRPPDLIDLKESKEIQVRSVTGSVRLDSDADITMARVMVAMNNKSSRDTARRVSRAASQRATEGGFHGGPVAFGYQQRRDASGKVVAWEPHPEHAAWLQDAAQRLLAGESLYGICADWHRKGRRTNAGIVWRSRTLARNLKTPSIIGYREYKGDLYKAQWEPIMERETWDRLQILFEAQSANHSTWPRPSTVRKRPLLGIVFCGRCGNRLASMPGSKGGPAAYFCSTQATGGCGKLRIAIDRLEPWLLEHMVASIDTLKLQIGGDSDQLIQEAKSALLRDEAALNQMDDDHYAGLLPRSDWLRQRARVAKRHDETQTQLAELLSRSASASLPSGVELKRQWPLQDAHWQHAMVASVIDKVVIQPHPKGMALTLSRRRGESDADLESRRQTHLIKILRARVHITWRA